MFSRLDFVHGLFEDEGIGLYSVASWLLHILLSADCKVEEALFFVGCGGGICLCVEDMGLNWLYRLSPCLK
jgi:hypothetical protein